MNDSTWPYTSPTEGKRSIERGSPGQRAWGEQVVGGEQHDVVATDLRQAVVVGGDMAAIVLMHQHVDPVVPGSEIPGDVRAAVG